MDIVTTCAGYFSHPAKSFILGGFRWLFDD